MMPFLGPRLKLATEIANAISGDVTELICVLFALYNDQTETEILCPPLCKMLAECW